MADRRSPWNPRSSRSAQAQAVSDHTAPSSSSSTTPSNPIPHISNTNSSSSTYSSSNPPHITANPPPHSTLKAAPGTYTRRQSLGASNGRQASATSFSSTSVAIDYPNKSQRYLLASKLSLNVRPKRDKGPLLVEKSVVVCLDRVPRSHATCFGRTNVDC